MTRRNRDAIRRSTCTWAHNETANRTPKTLRNERMHSVTQTYQPQPPPQQQPKRTPTAVKLVVIAAILIWVGGCGAIIAAIGSSDPAAVPAPSSAAPAPTTAASSPSPAVQRYETVIELRDAAVAAGYPCPDWELWDPKKDGLEYAKEVGACSDVDYFSVYADDAALTKQIAAEEADPYRAEVVIGPNWLLRTTEKERKELAAALGGELVELGTEEPEPEPEKSEPGIGDKVRDDDYQFTVTKVRCGVSRVGSSWLGEKAQGQFCLVSLRVKNVGDDAINYSSENQTLIDTKGKEYSPDDEAWIYMDDSDAFGEINPGNTLTAIVDRRQRPQTKPQAEDDPSLVIIPGLVPLVDKETGEIEYVVAHLPEVVERLDAMTPARS